jgi:LacI family transcriptional regulator
MKGQGAKITLADVARFASVSPATASLALRDSPRIRSQTREKVWRVTQRLRYWTNRRVLQPRPITASAPKREVQNIGFILVGADETDRIYSHTFQAAVLETNRGGRNLFCCPWLNADTPPKRSLLDSTACGGFLLMGAVGAPHHEFLKQLGKPVLVAGDHRILEKVNEVNFRHFEAGREAVRYLAGLGHRRIAFVSENLSFAHRQAWHRGYLEEMKDLKLPVQDGWIQIRWQTTPHSEVIEPLFDLKERPTAILTTSEGEGHDAIECCKIRGLRVPQDISVFFLGPRRGDATRHPMTCLEAPMEALGRIAIKRLGELIDNPEDLPLTTLLNFHFCDGGSCTPPSSNRKKKGHP